MYSKILVPLDGSELAECVLPHVESISKGCGVKEVVFIRVVESVMLRYSGDEYHLMTRDFEKIDNANKAAAHNYLERQISRFKREDITFTSTVLIGHRVADLIADYASTNAIDLIIIATHGRSGISRWFMGSVAERILRSACVPVLMIRAPDCISDHK